MKVTRFENYRVEVTCSDPYIPLTRKGETSDQATHRRAVDMCREVANNIRRHVDNVATVTPLFDTVEYCDKCNERWDPYEDEDGKHCGNCGDLFEPKGATA